VGLRGGALSDLVGARDRFDWEAEGRRLGETLDGYSCLVVVGRDPDATALAALGIAQTQATKRRVAVGDLFGDVPAIQRFVREEDAHGLVDVILHGVSLNVVAVPVTDDGQFFVLPTGTEPADSEEVFTSPRWKRITARFRETDALLLLATPVDAPALERLVASADGAIVVGDTVPPQLSIADILGSVREPQRPTFEPVEGRRESRRIEAPRRSRFPKGGPALNTRAMITLGGSLLALVLAAIVLWMALRNGPGGSRSAEGPAGSGASRRIASTDTPRGRTDSAAGSAGSRLLPVPANPADSASAAAYSVMLVSSNTAKGAILRLQKDASTLPAATFSPVLVDGVTWFQLRAGAFNKASQADSLVRWLRRTGWFRRSGNPADSIGGQVVRAPLAFLLDSAVQAGAITSRVAAYVQKDRPAYALQQPNGKFNVYVGAFQTPEESLQLAEQLRAAGDNPTLVYRTGRVF
jgi:hypothetical protein